MPSSPSIADRTLGIDLASQPKATGGCLIRWHDGEAQVEHLAVNLTDDRIIELAATCDKIGIDAPFGWPQPFSRFLQSHTAGQLDPDPWTRERRDAFRFRQTDVCVQQMTGLWPLSVSSDRIAITAMRCAGLLAMLGSADRSGGGQAVEVYPAVALHQWRLLPRGYKGVKNAAVLAKLIAKLQQECCWLTLSSDQATLLARSDHAFDALISALVARAAALNLTAPIPEQHRSRAATEGWIHVPEPGSLARLVNP